MVHILPGERDLPDLTTVLVTLVRFDGHLFAKHKVAQALF